MATTTLSNSERRTLQSSQKERGCFFAYSSHSLIYRTINVTIAYVLYTFITFLLIGFTLYIVFRFWTKPTSEWVTASDYGSSVYGAVFICAHWVGGVLVNLCGCVTASIFGFIYIFTRSTVGGAATDLPFAMYGILLISYAMLTIFYAQRKQIAIHKRWAVRTFALGIGSALYRLYVSPIFIYAVSDRQSSVAGELDYEEKVKWLTVAAWLFFLPNLVVAEIWILWYWGYEVSEDDIRNAEQSNGRDPEVRQV
ncbi:6209_t:CDS:2 [Paraglomus brasilianum]|uniref:6209_t:CDS:1 n=1 Tax=Paraglomus brasilianum TaxID=144538 RepID=A0A9N8WJ06_9GLOM|nr:6209_t:CDS:2 [Paraglomus brasilianum]